MSSLQDNYSENEDDPAVYESSGDEWDEATEKKRNKRRTSQRLSKKPRVTHVESSESENDEAKPKSKNGINKKTKKVVSPAPAPAAPTTPPEPAPVKRVIPTVPKANTNFITGTFVILKKDAQSGDITKPPCIWKIDGKALLQKYEPFDEDGKVRHRNTSIYTGWSALDKDQYAPIQVQVCLHSGQKMIVELNWEQLKTINIDSD